MKYIILLFLYVYLSKPCVSQTIIDSAAVNHWVSLGGERAISNDGNYFMYMLSNQPMGENTLMVRSLTGSWQRSYADASGGFFSEDSRRLIFLVGDTLQFVSVGTDLPDRKLIISSYKQPESGKGEWLAYQLKDTGRMLVLLNLQTAAEQRFNGIADYSFDGSGNSLLLKTVNGLDSIGITTLQWVSLSSGKATKIWPSENGSPGGGDIFNYTMDAAGKQIVFMVRGKGAAHPAIWFYRAGMDRATVRVDSLSAGNLSGLSIGSSLKFSEDGRYILLQLQGPENQKAPPDAVSLDIWSYSDTLLQGTQLFETAPKTYEAAIGVDGGPVIRLTRDYEHIKAMPVMGDFAVIGHNDEGDRFWLHQQDSNWLVSLRDGSRRSIPTGEYTEYWFSPDGHYLMYYAFNKAGNYFSMDLSTGKIKNISAAITTPLNVKDVYLKGVTIQSQVGMAGWQKDRSLLVYDNYDLWELDPTGVHPAINITHGYGLANHIKFRLVSGMDKSGALLLVAFNPLNKYNGFYKVQPAKSGMPQLLTMGPWTFDHQGASVYPVNANEFSDGMAPLKARDTDSWIVMRQTATEAPNYFLTHDFKGYRALTNLQPQAAYNWLTTELVSWRQLDGTISQGALYKPQDFDPHKKYPVLFTYYEQLSHRVYEYPEPDYTRNSINIPWFVSLDYLVFTPDIYYTKGKPGWSAYNTVQSAALFLSKLPFVDAKHMGINGHSFGGFETNYLITHSRLFAAAVEGAGTSDWISSALELWGVQGSPRGSRLGSYEGQMAATLWQRPDLYRENSPVLQADKVSTPLLIFHSKDDTAVPWDQAIELFIALRRLSKRVWMLQYDGQPHGNWGKAAEDFTIRITQFFDHYLKDAPAPVWMTRGVPARLKGIIQ